MTVKTRQVTCLMTPDEFETLRVLAFNNRMSISGYIRSKTLDV